MAPGFSGRSGDHRGTVGASQVSERYQVRRHPCRDSAGSKIGPWYVLDTQTGREWFFCDWKQDAEDFARAMNEREANG